LEFHSGREADHSPLSSAEDKEWVELTSTPPIRLHGVVLSEGEHRDNFTFTLDPEMFVEMQAPATFALEKSDPFFFRAAPAFTT
jgi:hypothetical protein